MIYDVSFVPKVDDLPAFRALLSDYYTDVWRVAVAAGLPEIDPQELVDSSIDHLDEMLPPKGRLLLASDPTGRLVGCGALRFIGPDAAEMKRMYVRPEARRKGLARQLFDMRMAEARRMGRTTVYADTAKGNRPMLQMYEAAGFQYTARYPGNANPTEFAPSLVFLEYRFARDVPAP